MRSDEFSYVKALLPCLIGVPVIDAESRDEFHTSAMALIGDHVQRLGSGIQKRKETFVLFALIIVVVL